MRSVPKHKLSKTAITAWRISTLLWTLFLLVIPFSLWAIREILQDSFFSVWSIAAFGLVLVVMVVLLVLFVPEIRWRRWFYQVDEYEVDLQSGILIIRRTLVPVKRVQHVDTRQGPVLRLFGLSDVTISTAATTHRIPALGEETADKVRNQISKFARLAQEDV
jgi:membrane protein YdbS with pleckstrin-like domain